ncbi:MAG: glycine--tRNA ligase [Saprospiraceae bacterium]|nr:glycine--tRNA ligase [Saprospiraceae bacterium]
MDFKKITSHAKEYGFIFQSSEIYDGLAAVYDYGQNGAALKNNIKNYWWKAMVQSHEEIVGIDSAIFMHPKTWKASGHVDVFNDPLIDNKDSKKRYRADVLIEEFMDKLETKAEKEIKKARKRFGDSFDREVFVSTNERVKGYYNRRDESASRLATAMKDNDLEDLRKHIEDLEIACPVSGSRNWTDVRQFNLMFSTQLGNIAGEEGKLYLRPETAQGIFVNFLNVAKTSRQRIPFGIAQIGKAFRNEIIARQFIFRMREFEQMEMQFFVRPGDELKWYEHWKEERMRWHLALGTPKERFRFHEHDNLAHYANAAVDIHYQFPFGFKELEGIHSRTDFDLRSHEELSGRKMQYYDPELEKSYIPYVVETSIGLDRMFLSQLSESLQEETVPDASGKESQRIVMKLHPILAPVKCAVLPLVKNKPELTEKARKMFDDLKYVVDCQYDEKDAIGRRYRRQDAVGTPWCVTVDFDTLTDDTVTLRDRDTLQQKRVSVEEVKTTLRSGVDLETTLRSI